MNHAFNDFIIGFTTLFATKYVRERDRERSDRRKPAKMITREKNSEWNWPISRNEWIIQKQTEHHRPNQDVCFNSLVFLVALWIFRLYSCILCPFFSFFLSVHMLLFACMRVCMFQKKNLMISLIPFSANHHHHHHQWWRRWWCCRWR